MVDGQANPGQANPGRAIFRFRDFRFYVSARFLWGLAMQMQTVAVAWLVYDLTDLHPHGAVVARHRRDGGQI